MSDNNDALASTGDGFASAASIGCPEARLFMNRRNLLGMSVGLFTWGLMPRVASAAGSADPRLLIVLLRGGIDGLNVVANTGDENYARLRGKLKLDTRTSSPLNIADYSGYSINNLMPNYKNMLASGEARMVLPIAPPLRSRSHFDCSFNLENGYDAGSIAHDGWLNRLLYSMRPSADQLPPAKWSTVSIGNTPVILTGAETSVLTWTPTFFSNEFFQTSARASLTTQSDPLWNLYGETGHAELQSALSSGLDTDLKARRDMGLFRGLNGLQSTFVGAASLLRGDVGPRIAVITVDNFDSHIGESDKSTQVLANFDSSLGKFKNAMGDAWAKTVVVCVSEFGRTVTENGFGGSDHGTGTVALLAGGAFNTTPAAVSSASRARPAASSTTRTAASTTRSPIIGRWPTLVERSLLDNMDVPADYDTRTLFRAVLREHLDVPDATLNTIFPGTDPATRSGRSLLNIANLL